MLPSTAISIHFIYCYVLIISQNGGGNCHSTDPYLSGLDSLAVQATCLWRRALHAATETNRILIPSFARRLGVETTVATGLVQRLEKEGYCEPAKRGKRYSWVRECSNNFCVKGNSVSAIVSRYTYAPEKSLFSKLQLVPTVFGKCVLRLGYCRQ